MSLQVVSLAGAVPIYPPGHVNVQPFQLQGGPEAPTDDLNVILSHYLPGGRADSAAMIAETIYVVVAGELVVLCDGEEVTLRVFDSVRLARGAIRKLENQSRLPASVLVIRSTRLAD